MEYGGRRKEEEEAKKEEEDDEETESQFEQNTTNENANASENEKNEVFS